MEKEQKKVICIRADGDKDYEQIIFVMKDEAKARSMKEKGRINLVMEAENIISSKFDSGNICKEQKNAVLERGEIVDRLVIRQKSTFDIVLNACMIVGCIFLVAALVFLS